MRVKQRPLVSFVVVAYKQERFVAEAVRSALAQTYEPLEVILSDDCSPDQTYEVVKEEAARYKGPHRIILNRNDTNLGLAGNLNRAFERAQGEFIVVQAGDDISVPDRSDKLVRYWQTTDPPVDLVCSYFEEIDVHGKSTGFIKQTVAFVPDTKQHPLRWACGATGACAAYSRRLYDKYGPLDPRVISEDWVYSFRAWLESGIGVVKEPLVRHRTHDSSISVLHRTLGGTYGNAARRLRRRMAEGQLAIADEWLRAWKSNRQMTNGQIETKLAQLVSLRRLQLHAYDCKRFDALKTAFLTLRHGGGIRLSLKLILRHVVGWQGQIPWS